MNRIISKHIVFLLTVICSVISINAALGQTFDKKQNQKKDIARKSFEITQYDKSSILQQNLSNVKVDALTDEQIQKIIDQVIESGRDIEEVERVVMDRGMSRQEAAKLMKRIQSLDDSFLDASNKQTKKKTSKDDEEDADIRKDKKDKKDVYLDRYRNKKEDDLPVFGVEYFDNPESNFAPNVNRPTPRNYIVGPDDRLKINVYGNSVVDWNLTVTPEGYILLPGMGNVYVGGKTIENATEMIKDRLRANRYAIGNGTEVAVSLSNIRTIRVNINGEVKRPGPYTVSSLTTLLNALYEAGGPNDIGSMRSIQLFRNNMLIQSVDVYDYILRGDKSGDVLLEDDDIINVQPYRVRVAIEGEVKRPAYYELKPGEVFKDVLVNFAGGFTDEAYRASVKAEQISDRGRMVKDIPASEFDNYVPLKGDRYIVEPVLDRYENRISIEGAVFRPGQYELEAGLTLAELIKKADGLKEDAFMGRGTITRLKPDNTTELISFDPKGVVDGTAPPIPLKREDIVTITSLFDLRLTYNVSINGSVRKPGKFSFDEGMTVEDLILRAGGFADGANMKVVEIARRVKDSDQKSRNAKLSEIITLDIDPDLKVAHSKFKLEPFDVVSVFSLPGYVKPQIVTIEGEVMYPGTYAMRNKEDRISDLIKRAKGFTAFAYLKGASLKRADHIETETDEEKQQLKLVQLNQKQLDVADGEVSVDLENKAKRNDFVDIDLEAILKKPRSRKDLILLDGDVINIPRELQTVKITGEVFSPTTTVYTPGQSLSAYVMRSGGFTEDALRRKPYVVYANGAIKSTKSFIFFRNYPNLEPGAEIFVPKKKPKREGYVATVTQTWVGLGSALATASSTIFTAIVLMRNK